MSLLSEAKKIEVRLYYKNAGKYNLDELADLSIAWAKREVTASQISGALNKSKLTGNYLYAMATGLRHAMQTGKLIEKSN